VISVQCFWRSTHARVLRRRQCLKQLQQASAIRIQVFLLLSYVGGGTYMEKGHIHPHCVYRRHHRNTQTRNMFLQAIWRGYVSRVAVEAAALAEKRLRLLEDSLCPPPTVVLQATRERIDIIAGAVCQAAAAAESAATSANSVADSLLLLFQDSSAIRKLSLSSVKQSRRPSHAVYSVQSTACQIEEQHRVSVERFELIMQQLL
jgi:hypothetical protein